MIIIFQRTTTNIIRRFRYFIEMNEAFVGLVSMDAIFRLPTLFVSPYKYIR